jgi:SAM-dependent methyltransferase
VLYFGVGAGRLAVPLADAGVELVGVDVHPGMLHRLHARRPGMHLVQARIENLDLTERFDLVIAPSGILCTAPRARSALRHLARAGRVAFELTNPHWLRVAQHPDVRVVQIQGDRAAIEVDYHFEDGAVYTQVADVEVIWPEAIEGWLGAVGFHLKSLRAAVSGPLDESPTYYVEAVSAEPSR